MKVLSIEIFTPEEKINSNDLKKFRKCLSEGFFVFEEKDGYKILRKRPKILVTIEHGNQQFTKNLRAGLVAIYGAKNDEKKLVELFEEDLKNDSVTIEMDSEGYFLVVKK